jgi:hypothetical protein
MKSALPVASQPKLIPTQIAGPAVNPNLAAMHAKGVSQPVQSAPVYAPHPYISQYSLQSYPVQGLTPYLGQYTRMDASGNVQLNLPLVEQIVAYREAAIPALYGFLSQSQNILAICEALYTAQRLCETGVQGVGQLYGATQFLHNNPHPLVQIYLSGFYRKLNAPETFGPLLTMLMRNALQPGPPVPGAFNPQEEVGGAILDLIANKAAEKMKTQK